MATYSVLSWLACLSTSLLLGISIWRDRSLLIRPSIFVLLFFHLMIQWAATIDAERIYAFLPDPWAFALLTQAFPLVGLVVALTMGRGGQHAIWQRIVKPRRTSALYRRRVLLALGTGIAVVAAYYFTVVPVQQTGLYAILTNPAQSEMARENSLKLIDNQLLKYLYSFMAGAFAPITAVLLAEQVFAAWKPLRLKRALPGLIGIVAVLLVASPTGSRGAPAGIVMAILLAWLLRRGFPLNPAHIALALLAVLTLPTVLTVLREGRELDWGGFWRTFERGIIWRAFYLPMDTGTWYAHYAQTFGFVGIRGIPKLAAMFGLDAPNVPNIVGLLYARDPGSTINANTCYVFSYYSYFGPLSLPVSLLGLWLLDGALWVYRRTNDYLLLPCVVAVCKASTAFVSADYTLVFLSNGWAMALLLALALDRLPGSRREATQGTREDPVPQVGIAAGGGTNLYGGTAPSPGAVAVAHSDEACGLRS